jgi:NADH-quinone oxidoreductase subunit G
MSQDLVTITVDGNKIQVPKGTNIIDAAKSAGIEIPHYCYHPHLSVAGNCRMCQVELNGRPKLEIACNTTASEGLEVKTHNTSKAVADAQAATLEFILINHPLDCTVCDQAGHCKLQDYHYEYNAKQSRFLEEKEHKVKAQPLGPTVVLDGERCIMCSRCVRFCDEITGTSEIGLINRGDHTVISVSDSRPLNNALSGTVVDLCPVGALTHRQWRFNTRIWFTKQSDGICPGCSTGCNVKVATRDSEIVQVKARHNPDVNKEWLCDEGRYGFGRFLPKNRLTNAIVNNKESSVDDAIATLKNIAKPESVVFLAADLTSEEYAIISELKKTVLKDAHIVVGYKERTLTKVEAVLISPDYAPNYQAAKLFGLVSGDLQMSYEKAVKDFALGKYKQALIIGDRAIADADISVEFVANWSSATTIFIGTNAHHRLVDGASAVIGSRSIVEKSGVLVNRTLRAQYTDRFVDAPENTIPDWKVLLLLAKALNAPAASLPSLSSIVSERDLTLWLLKANQKFGDSSIKSLKSGVAIEGVAA